MEKQFDSSQEMFDFFKEKKNCIAYFTYLRWQDNITCPHCNHTKIYTLKSGYKCANNQCYKKFNCFTKTTFENSKISLRNWFAAIYQLTNNPKGLSSYQLAKQLKVKQPTAWFMLHRIREFLKEKDTTEMLTGIIQLDETAVGGKNKNRHKNKKVANSQGRSHADKTWVFGMVKNNEACARVFVVPNTDIQTLVPIIRSNIDSSATIVTDGHKSYWGLDTYYQKHVMVKIDGNYSSAEGYNTNRIEGLWSHLKRMYKGTYHHMSKKHLQRYCDELAYRYNNKSDDDCLTFEKAISRIDGATRLKYKDLIAGGRKKAKIGEDLNTIITHKKLRTQAEFLGNF